MFAEDKERISVYQIDIHAEELGNNIRPAVALNGDLKSVVTQVTFVMYQLLCSE